MQIPFPSICAILNVAQSAQREAQQRIYTRAKESILDLLENGEISNPFKYNRQYRGIIALELSSSRHILSYVDPYIITEFVYQTLKIHANTQTFTDIINSPEVLKKRLINTMVDASRTCEFNRSYVGFTWDRSLDPKIWNDMLAGTYCDLSIVLGLEYVADSDVAKYNLDTLFKLVKLNYEYQASHHFLQRIDEVGTKYLISFEIAEEISRNCISRIESKRRDPFNTETYRGILEEQQAD